MSVGDVASNLLLLGSSFYFLAGTVGILRFPDALTRLHAVTKADNLGLGFLVLALIFRAEGFWVGAKLVLIWMLVLLSSASVCYLLARSHASEMRTEGQKGGRDG
jgi:multicomponent Na+:H+ antiporter subunit G